MERRDIGSLEVSVVGLGCNNFGRRMDEASAHAVVAASVEGGITLFDTADVYGPDGVSEEILGRALGRRRDDVVIATKFGFEFGGDPQQKGASPRWIAAAVEGSLRRLGTDRIDLYQLHEPDGTVPIDETLGALDLLVVAGKVREVGCSNFSAAQLHGAMDAATGEGRARFVSVQNHYSVITREPEPDVIDACLQHGLAFIPYFPLEGGLLSGKYGAWDDPTPGTRLGNDPRQATRFMTDRNRHLVAELTRYAADHGHSLLELAMSWVASRPAVASVIAGATKVEQVEGNIAAVRWALTDEDVSAIDAIAQGAPAA